MCMRVRVVALQTNNLQKEIRSRDKTRSTLATMSRVPENTGLFDAYKSLNMEKKVDELLGNVVVLFTSSEKNLPSSSPTGGVSRKRSGKVFVT